MFTVEIKVNGSIISCINCKNITNRNEDSDEDLYEYECYTYEKDLIKNKIKHKRADGIHKIVGKILNQVSKELEK
jgi:hypothetical protein